MVDDRLLLVVVYHTSYQLVEIIPFGTRLTDCHLVYGENPVPSFSLHRQTISGTGNLKCVMQAGEQTKVCMIKVKETRTSNFAGRFQS